MSKPDWIVIGAGVIGLAAAWALAQDGQRVDVVEASRVGDGTSTKAAGMLLPEVESVHSSQLFPMATESLALYPDWVSALERASGQAVGYAATGCLVLAEAKAFSASWPDLAASLGSDLAAVQPGLAPGLAGCYLPNGAQVDPPLLMAALRTACLKAGVTIREHAAVTEIRRVADRWLGITAGQDRLLADHYLLATGAWTTQLTAELDVDLGIFPVKGQMVELEAPAGALSAILFGPRVYLCQKQDGRVLVGATSERVGFDLTVSEQAVADLLARAAQLLPAVASWPVRRSWAGLRPGREGLPVIEAISQNALAAVGHYRNGILLAPLTATRLCELARQIA
ncbi:MAG: glycine oxidase ThiO [Sulfobacillus sp.]